MYVRKSLQMVILTKHGCAGCVSDIIVLRLICAGQEKLLTSALMSHGCRWNEPTIDVGMIEIGIVSKAQLVFKWPRLLNI